MPVSRETDILIVGAGAAGLTLAIDLARRGVRFRLVEKLAQPFAGSRGKGIQPRSQELFEDLGVLDRLVASGGPYPLQRVYHADGSHQDSWLMEPCPATPAEPFPMPLMVAQFLTEAVLRDRLADFGGTVEFAHELTALAQDEHGVTASLATPAGEETLRTRYIVGCDGGRSFVRHALGVEFPGKTLDSRAVVADVLLTGLTNDAWHRWNGNDRARQMSICPLVGTPLFQIQAPVPMTGDIDTSASGLAAMIADRTGRDDIVIDQVTWASVYTMNARLAERYRVGRVFLAGDAAHTHPPTGGQGLNTSVQDAYNLGWKLAAALTGAPDALLDSYEAERRPIAAQMLGLSAKLLDAMKQGDMRRGREVHQLDLGYVASPIAFEPTPGERSIQAGDRAPDAPLTAAAGQPCRLFDLLRGPHWTAIGYQVADQARLHFAPGVTIHHIGPDAPLRDSQGHFAAAYGLEPGSWLLIRPDGYIGAIVAADEVERLGDYGTLVGLGFNHRI